MSKSSLVKAQYMCVSVWGVRWAVCGGAVGLFKTHLVALTIIMN